MAMVRFEDGSYELIKTTDDAKRILHERLGREPAEAIIGVFEKRIKEKDEEIDSLRREIRL